MGKLDAKGRSREARHIRLYAWLTKSAAWADLTGNAVKLLIYLATWEDGRNNGELFMSERMAAAGIGVSKRTAHSLFRELEEHGFIAPTTKGYFNVKVRRATQWRLTWLPAPAERKGPSHEYRNWPPLEQNPRVQKRTATGAIIASPPSPNLATGAKITSVGMDSAETTGAIIDPHTVAIVGPKGGGDSTSHEPDPTNLIPFPPPPPRSSACECCGGTFLPGDRGLPKRFCGEPCRRKMEKNRARFRKRTAGAIT